MIDLLRDEKILFRVLCRCRPIQFRYSFNTASASLQMPDSPRTWMRIRRSVQRGWAQMHQCGEQKGPKRLLSRKPTDVHSNIRRVYSRPCFPRSRGDRFREAIQQRQAPRGATNPAPPLTHRCRRGSAQQQNESSPSADHHGRQRGNSACRTSRSATADLRTQLVT